jgi:tetratricopeptide (TPR) repeat protein
MATRAAHGKRPVMAKKTVKRPIVERPSSAPPEPTPPTSEPPAPTPERLLGLVMIIKDEAHSITDTLETFRPHIDYWTILDTGSTDGTQEIVKRVLSGVPGQLVEEPFVDFATSRNRALDLHEDRTTFTIMPDSEDRLVHGDVLRAYALANVGSEGLAHEAYDVNIRRENLSYYLPLLLRTRCKWRYSGRVHECCGRPGAPPAQLRVPSVEVTQTPREKSIEATKKRWERDLVLLEADRTQDPTNPRTLFYLAQTYDCLGRNEEALATYEERIRIGGWHEETFEAALRKPRMMNRLAKPWPEVQQAYLEAHMLEPKRAEPLYEIAEHYYYKHDNLPMTFLFARRAMELPLPNATLFVDRDVYDWKAAHLVAIAGFYLDDSAKRAGKWAAEKATAGRGDDLIRANRIFYVRSAVDLFGAKTWRIPYVPAEPFVAANPSVHYDQGTWRCIVRTLNYRIVNGTSYIPPDNVIITRNMMVDLDGDPAHGFSINKAVEMIDRSEAPRTDYPCRGFEDCRLFRAGSKLYCTATVCDFSTEEWGRREIVLCELDDNDYAIVNATPLRGPWSRYNQKNWMPLAMQDENATIVYSMLPAATIKVGISREARQYRIEGPSEPPLANPHLRGGSQLVQIEDGYLCLIHDVIFGHEYRRTYLHRFVWLDKNFVAKKMSELFYFEHQGIEYAAGLALDGSGKHLVASYSVNDANANLAIFETSTVLKSLREDFVV